MPALDRPWSCARGQSASAACSHPCAVKRRAQGRPRSRRSTNNVLIVPRHLASPWSCSHRVVINDSKACSQCPLCKLAQAALLKQPLCGTGMFLRKKGNGVGFPRGTLAFGGLLPSSARGRAPDTPGRGWQSPAALLQARLFALGELWLYYLCNNKLRGCRYCSG